MLLLVDLLILLFIYFKFCLFVFAPDFHLLVHIPIFFSYSRFFEVFVVKNYISQHAPHGAMTRVQQYFAFGGERAAGGSLRSEYPQGARLNSFINHLYLYCIEIFVDFIPLFDLTVSIVSFILSLVLHFVGKRLPLNGSCSYLLSQTCSYWLHIIYQKTAF